MKPKFLIPIHGEYRHLKVHKDVAVNMGMPARNVVLADLGSQVEMTPSVIKEIGKVKAGSRLVDGSGMGDINSPVLRDRKQLSEDGFVVAVLNISGITNDLAMDPIVATRGLVYDSEDKLLAELKSNLAVYVKNYDIKETDQMFLKNEIKKFLANFISKRTGRRPIILVMTLIS